MTQTTIHTADITAWLRGNQWLVQNGYMPKAHAVIGDPPYGLEFMGKAWDKPKPSGLMANRDANQNKLPRFDGNYNGNKNKTNPFLAAAVNKYVAGADYQAWVAEWATLLLDFVHPGAVLALFGGTRTYHRLACGLEEAGWEIFDSLMYVYGSGFPKSHDISKALDREAGATREVVGSKIYADGGKRPAIWSSENTHDGWKGPAHENYSGYRLLTAPATPNAATWNGYGTALKPAYEPLILARAPRGGRTYAQLAREFGTAALNVDGGRIDVEDNDPNKRQSTGGYSPSGKPVNLFWNNGSRDATLTQGRWPANFALVHSPDCGATCAPGCPVAALEEQSGESVSSGGGGKRDKGQDTQNGIYGTYNERTLPPNVGIGDSGNASRFFYTAKASAFERALPDGRRNPHPTVKPIQLIEWLATLLLPPAGIGERRLLVPFAGSGSEMIGAQLAGWDVITGIEQSAEYAAIAKARLAWWSQFTSYDAAKERYDSEQRGASEDAALEDAGQLRLFELAS